MSVAALVAMDPWGWDRFGPFHWALLSVLSLVAIARTLAGASSSGAATTRIDPLLWIGWGVLLGGLTLSTALSDDRWHAVVGTPDRHLGLVTWLIFFGIFGASMLWFSGPGGDGSGREGSESHQIRGKVDTFVLATSAGLLVVALYGILELLGISGFESDFAGGRIGSTFGQPAYLGAATVLVTPLAAALACESRYPTWKRIVGALSSLGGVVMLAASQSRGAWVGAVIAVVVVLLANRSRLAGMRQSDHIRLLGLVAAVVVGVAAIPALRQRAWSLTDLDGVVAGRSDEWQVGLRTLGSGGKAGGLVGLGPETYRTRFGEFVDTEYVIDYGRVVFTDRAHSSIVDTALAGGWIGLAGYLFVAIVIVRACVVLLRGSNSAGSDNWVDVAIGASAIGYLVQQLFLFPLAELDPLFWIIAGLAVARASSRDSQPNPWAISLPPVALDAGAIGAGALAFVALFAGGLDVLADHRISQAVDEPSNTVALDLADSARSLRPDSIRYDFIAARIAQRELPDGFERALVRLADGLSISPNDPALLVEQATVQLESSSFSTSADPLEAVLVSLAHLERVDPNNPRMQEKYGIALALNGEYAEAIPRLQRAVQLLPDNIEPLVNLSEVQEQAGQRAAACESLRAAAALSPENETVRTRISEKSC